MIGANYSVVSTTVNRVALLTMNCYCVQYTTQCNDWTVDRHCVVELNLSIACGQLWDLMYSGTCLMWSSVGPHIQWDLSNVVTCGTSSTVGPV